MFPDQEERYFITKYYKRGDKLLLRELEDRMSSQRLRGADSLFHDGVFFTIMIGLQLTSVLIFRKIHRHRT